MLVREAVKKIPLSSLVHVELASIADVGFVKEVIEATFGIADSLGLNEQELIAVIAALNSSKPSLSSLNFHPTVQVVADSINSIFIAAHSTTGQLPLRQLSRIHLHNLVLFSSSMKQALFYLQDFHAVAHRDCKKWDIRYSNTCKRWISGTASVVAGSLQCTQQACGREGAIPLDEVEIQLGQERITKKDGKVTVVSPSTVTKWYDAVGVDFFVAPVMVCKYPIRTVGLGDSISASGLLYDRAEIE